MEKFITEIYENVSRTIKLEIIILKSDRIVRWTETVNA